MAKNERLLSRIRQAFWKKPTEVITLMELITDEVFVLDRDRSFDFTSVSISLVSAMLMTELVDPLFFISRWSEENTSTS